MSDPADTFLDVRGWKKGVVFINGHNLGHYWGIGPTQTMYLPGCWLTCGENELVVWDFAGTDWQKVGAPQGRDTPILGELHPDLDISSGVKVEAETEGQKAGAMQ